MRQFTFDLSAASISSDTNPFVSSSTSSSTSSSSPSASSSTSPSSPSSSNSNPGTQSSSSSTIGPSPEKLADYEKAHGIIMGTTVVLLFPIGASYMRLFGNPSLHALWQIFSLVALLCGFGVGVKLAQMTNYVCFPLVPWTSFSPDPYIYPSGSNISSSTNPQAAPTPSSAPPSSPSSSSNPSLASYTTTSTRKPGAERPSPISTSGTAALS
jgi:hypothetical protein